MSTVKLSDDFLRVPRLDVGGANWVIYKDRFRWAADARGYLGHVDGTTTEPTAPLPVPAAPATPAAGTTTPTTPAAGATAPAAPTPDPTAVQKYEEALAAWRKGEAVVKQMVAGTIPDSLFMKVRGQRTAHAIWTALAGDFEKKSRMVSVDLRR